MVSRSFSRVTVTCSTRCQRPASSCSALLGLMAPKPSQPSLSQPSKKAKSTKMNVVKLGESVPSSQCHKKFDPLTGFSNSTREGTPSTISKSGKGKGKGKAKDENENDGRGYYQWVDLYEPKTLTELAVHKKKVEDVRQWIEEALDGGPSGRFIKYRRILALTGGAGTGKTASLRVLAHEMGFDILEWRNTVSTTPFHGFDDPNHTSNFESSLDDYGYESMFTNFEVFLNRAASCQNLFLSDNVGSAHKKLSQTRVQSPETRTSYGKRHIILIEDLPNILHHDTQTKFHNALRALVEAPPVTPSVPVVIIVSDAGMRGEARDELLGSGMSWDKERDQVIDVRTVLSKDLLNGPYVTQISFNPIAPTLMRKALQNLLDNHFLSHQSCQSTLPSKEVLDIIIDSANGDIRSAVMALEFACIVKSSGRSKKDKSGITAAVLEAVTRREQSLVLFHLIGKIFYNKRKGDHPSASASRKDIQKEQKIDSKLNDPPELPEHLNIHARRTSRVDVNMIYADSPIDSSLFALYLHQNYTQFCNGVDECESISDWMSWVDSSGGEVWYQANPHRFHVLAMSTLHSLPSPITRRSQKVFKPEYFGYLQKEKRAREAVQDTKHWAMNTMLAKDGIAWQVGGWSNRDVALEVGGILKAKGASDRFGIRPPVSHPLFSQMAFGRSNGDLQQLAEGDVESRVILEDERVGWTSAAHIESHAGGWLDSDDIEEFE